MGNFELFESSVPEGYLRDEKIYTFNFEYKDMYTAVIPKTGTVYNEVKREPFEIVKISSDTNDTAVLLENVEFTAILKRYVEHYGSFQEALKHTSEYKDDEWCIIRTSANGYGISTAMSYGTYVVSETKNDYEGVNKVKDFEVTLRNNSDVPTQHWKAENDTPFTSYIKMVKKDANSGKIVVFSNATFKLEKQNEQTKEWERIKCKVGKDYYDKWTTDSEGRAYSETKLKYRNI